MMSSDAYQEHRERKIAWYDKHFPGRLIETFEGPQLSQQTAQHIDEEGDPMSFVFYTPFRHTATANAPCGLVHRFILQRGEGRIGHG